ncbi:MAG TPA: hypothetical protein PK122_02530 [Candidatus Paceibacterota bacterium]|nr:hypothetical protein [Candidatus Paceibacterota bacterium]
MNFQMNFGLIVVDPLDEGNILHFCGYWDKPGERDIELLRQELKEDPEFGLQEIWDKVKILEAPEDMVAGYRKIIELYDEIEIEEGEIEDEN